MCQVPEITVAELNRQVQNGLDPYLLDVRTSEEFEAAHLPFTRLLIPHDALANRLHELPADKEIPIYTFCRSGRRSAYAVELLRSAGYRNSFNVAGGILAWVAAGYEITSG